MLPPTPPTLKQKKMGLHSRVQGTPAGIKLVHNHGNVPTHARACSYSNKIAVRKDIKNNSIYKWPQQKHNP